MTGRRYLYRPWFPVKTFRGPTSLLHDKHRRSVSGRRIPLYTTPTGKSSAKPRDHGVQTPLGRFLFPRKTPVSGPEPALGACLRHTRAPSAPDGSSSFWGDRHSSHRRSGEVSSLSLTDNLSNRTGLQVHTDRSVHTVAYFSCSGTQAAGVAVGGDGWERSRKVYGTLQLGDENASDPPQSRREGVVGVTWSRSAR